MNHLVLYKKTGFKIINPNIPVVILDFRKRDFYDNSELTNKDKFNLPIGEYWVKSGTFTELSKPVDYPLNRVGSIKPFERTKKWPLHFKIVFSNNPNKASIDWKNKIIIFDNGLKRLTLPEIMFIYYHEIAHARYLDEKFVDRLAENILLIKGYNPSQTSKAPFTALSDKQQERKIDSFKRNMQRNENAKN